MNEWCEHVEIHDGYVKYSRDRKTWGASEQGDSWTFCPFCGAERPEKVKKLWEVLMEKRSYCSEDLANFALDVVLGVVDEVLCIKVGSELGVCKDELKKRLEELR